MSNTFTTIREMRKCCGTVGGISSGLILKVVLRREFKEG